MLFFYIGLSKCGCMQMNVLQTLIARFHPFFLFPLSEEKPYFLEKKEINNPFEPDVESLLQMGQPKKWPISGGARAQRCKDTVFLRPLSSPVKSTPSTWSARRSCVFIQSRITTTLSILLRWRELNHLHSPSSDSNMVFSLFTDSTTSTVRKGERKGSTLIDKTYQSWKTSRLSGSGTLMIA
jgi:hypothetical protein